MLHRWLSRIDSSLMPPRVAVATVGWLLTVLTSSLSLAAPAGWAPLLEPDAAARILESGAEVRILHVTGAYDRGHLPGAVSAPYERWRGPSDNPGQLPDLAALGELMRSLGLHSDLPVLVVHDGSNPADMGAAARVYWTLKSLGIRELAVLNGGYRAWRRADQPVSELPHQATPSDYQPRWDLSWRVTTTDVEGFIGDPSVRLIDARPSSFFNGLRATVGKPGTIAGAGNLTYESWFDGDRLKSPGELATIHGTYPVPPATVNVSFCNTGHWAAINWFVLSELLAVPNTRLYAESVAEWSQVDRPMDNAASRGKVYREQAGQWLRDVFN